ncbi:hypothetical protein F4561_001405 [Lipingzhangella halophila]|uniref:Uncharacterized protein n=1 Tax=Lipingzhangella halophila TaxID=1783352 RepID=A0A7W7W2F1_9ACTN|nr:hypothetical protein [Lipingzhangella halophila]
MSQALVRASRLAEAEEIARAKAESFVPDSPYDAKTTLGPRRSATACGATSKAGIHREFHLRGSTLYAARGPLRISTAPSAGRHCQYPDQR